MPEHPRTPGYCHVRRTGRFGWVAADQLVVDPVAAAHRLLGATLIGRGVRATVVEVEAYGGVPDGPWPDASAHSYRGLNGRNAVMFGPPGHLYTYRSHGIHVCANVSCGPDGVAAAVLLRAAAVDAGLTSPRTGAARPSVPSRWRAVPGICVRPWESPWPTTGLIYSIRRVRCGWYSTRRMAPCRVRGSGSARPPTGRGGCGLPAGPRCRLIAAVHGRPRRAPATRSASD